MDVAPIGFKLSLYTHGKAVQGGCDTDHSPASQVVSSQLCPLFENLHTPPCSMVSPSEQLLTASAGIMLDVNVQEFALQEGSDGEKTPKVHVVESQVCPDFENEHTVLSSYEWPSVQFSPVAPGGFNAPRDVTYRHWSGLLQSGVVDDHFPSKQCISSQRYPTLTKVHF